MKFKLEICIDNIESAIIAQESGAHRVELCSALTEGGTTPGYGTISLVRKKINIGLHVIIRPRGGDFLYSTHEFEIMKRDIEKCGEIGADGVVTGILLRNGHIDIERTARLIELARPMSVTFHRAFDMSNDPIRSLEDVIAAGADRLLTSGQTDKAMDGAELIRQLGELARERIIIMPGSGISVSNISELALKTKASEFHLTGRKIIDSSMDFRRDSIYMGGSKDVAEYSRKIADGELIRNIADKLAAL
jgi:copper homeostasis protein